MPAAHKFKIDRDRIRDERERQGLSMEAAARLAGIAGRQAWYRIETGIRRGIAAITLYRVAMALGVKVDSLIVKAKSAADADE
jgi:transcriptional regulator with XRE-family HTH domain